MLFGRGLASRVCNRKF